MQIQYALYESEVHFDIFFFNEIEGNLNQFNDIQLFGTRAHSSTD